MDPLSTDARLWEAVDRSLTAALRRIGIGFAALGALLLSVEGYVLLGAALGSAIFLGISLTIAAIKKTDRRRRLEEEARERAERAENAAERLASELRASEDQLAGALARARRLHQLTVSMRQRSELPFVLREILKGSLELLHTDKGHLQLYDERYDVLTTVAEVGFDADTIEAIELAARDGSPWGQSLLRRKRVIVEDVFESDANVDLVSALAAVDLLAVQATPLFGPGRRLVGVLSTYFRAPHRPADRELLFLDLYADQAGLAIDCSRVLQSEPRPLCQ